MTTLWLTAVAIVAGLLIGFALALARVSPFVWLVVLARFYIWIFRGTPLLVQLIIICTGLPEVGISMAVGLTDAQMMRHIIMPQAFTINIPPPGNSVNGLLKTPRSARLSRWRSSGVEPRS